MNLYEIDERLAACVTLPDGQVVDVETGEIIDTAALDALQMERSTKIENLGCWIKNELAYAEALKAEKQALAARQAAAEHKAEQLKQYLSGVLNGEKFKTPRVAISWRKSTSIVVADWHKLPEDMLRYKDPEPDKSAIKSALALGKVVPGCSLVAKNNIQVK